VWIYDAGVSLWKGYLLGPCNSPTVLKGPTSSQQSFYCTDVSLDPTVNTALGQPTFACAESANTLSAYGSYVDSVTPNCTGGNRIANYFRTWTYKSFNGQSNTTTQNFAVTMLAPAIDYTQTQTHTLNCLASTAPSYHTGGTGIGDLSGTIFPCGNGPMQYVDTIVNQTCPFNKTIVRTWFYTDFCDGVVDIPQSLIISDTQAPNITISNVTYTIFNETSPQYTGYPTYSDECTMNLTSTLIHSDLTLFDGGCTALTQKKRTWQVTDQCGHTSVVEQYLFIDYPHLYIPGPVTSECPFDTNPNVTGSASSTDLSYQASYFDTVVMPACSASTGSIYKSISRFWIVKDSCGSRNGTQQITIIDTTPPVIYVPSDLTLECNLVTPYSNGSLPMSSYLPWATAIDSCVGPLNTTVSDAQPYLSLVNTGQMPKCQSQVLNARTTVRTWSVTDECQNTNSSTQNVKFQDTIAPVFLIAPNISVSSLVLAREKLCVASVIDSIFGDVNANVTIIDNCDPSPSKFYSQNFTQTCNVLFDWALEDWCGNGNTSTFTVSVSLPPPPNAGSNIECHLILLVLLVVMCFITL
jgi:hypothetical protein